MICALCISLLNSCKKDGINKPINQAAVRFGASSYTIERNASEPLTVTVALTLPLEEDATFVLDVSDKSTVENGDYSIDPAIPAGGRTITLAKGATEITFNVSSSDNFEGDRDLVLTLSNASGGATIANTNSNTTISIKGKPIVLPEIVRSVTTIPSFGNVVTGTASASQVYTVTGIKLKADITLIASQYFKISLDNVNFSNTATINFASANAGPVNVYVKFYPSSGENKNLTGTISHSSGTVPTVVVNVSGSEYGNAAAGVLLANENFNYGSAAGNLKDLTNNWSIFSGSLNPIQYQTTSLSFPSYGSSGIGGSVVSENGSGSREDMYRSFPAQTSGTVYISQLVNVSASSSGNDFCLAMRDGSSYINRVYMHDNGGKLGIGIGKSSSTIEYSPIDYNYGTTYLVVTKYDFNTGTSSLYVLASGLTSIEPPTPTASTSAGNAPTTLENFIIRQSTGSLTLNIDGIRVATSWKEAVGL